MRTLVERELHLSFVGVAACDYPIAIPDGSSHPFPLLDYLRIGCSNDFANFRKGVAAPVIQFCYPFVDFLRWALHFQIVSLRTSLFFRPSRRACEPQSSELTQL